ncbi:FtsJ-like methyltransferase [Purpureocillium lavendulum]|uniref:rRNA methyltransferase 2, mitochondrial n=1 Tax=Purpureocillium lavendulum TaxID=1247861 RepID=A0AB34FXA8_9HYPO|nr:FtsJ-like methyltransferase [Purpureocillium lavendulum]
MRASPPLILASARRACRVYPRVAQRGAAASLAWQTQPWPPGRTAPSSSSSGSTRWKQRQGRDVYAREAKVQGLKSRAAFKLLEGYAPGSWSQVAMERTRPHGRVVGIDLIPAQPPAASPPSRATSFPPRRHAAEEERSSAAAEEDGAASEAAVREAVAQPSYIDQERHMGDAAEPFPGAAPSKPSGSATVDIVLSDMLMNTSGNAFRDHAGSMDLCNAALRFASDTLRPGGHFICKFYQGAEDKELEKRLRGLFAKVHREKPESSRSVGFPIPLPYASGQGASLTPSPAQESKEAYFIALRRKPGVVMEEQE